jgi:hypothetical protein
MTSCMQLQELSRAAPGRYSDWIVVDVSDPRGLCECVRRLGQMVLRCQLIHEHTLQCCCRCPHDRTEMFARVLVSTWDLLCRQLPYAPCQAH